MKFGRLKGNGILYSLNLVVKFLLILIAIHEGRLKANHVNLWCSIVRHFRSFRGSHELASFVQCIANVRPRKCRVKQLAY